MRNKSIRALIVGSLLCCSLVGCSNGNEASVNENRVTQEATGAVKADKGDKNADKGDKNADFGTESDDYILVNKRSLLDMYHNAQTLHDYENFIFSPYSLRDCFGILQPAVTGDSKIQMKSVLNVGNESVEKFNRVDKSYEFDGNKGIKIINKAYYNDQYKEKLALDKLGTSNVEALDVSDAKKAAMKVNKFISDNTYGKVDGIVEEYDFSGSKYMMTLVNTVYFNNEWGVPLKADKIHWRDREYIESFSGDSSNYDVKEVNEDIDLIRIPYKQLDNNVISMYIFCASESGLTFDEQLRNKKAKNYEFTASGYDKGYMIESLKRSLMEWTDEEFMELLDFDNYRSNLNYDNVYFNIPCFKYDTLIDLKDPLKDCGLTAPFIKDNNKDFSKLVNRDMSFYISDVKQKVYIDVNEKGTEAAAATVVTEEFGDVGAFLNDMPLNKYVVADDTFIFVIKNDTENEILFMGEVNTLGEKD